MKSFSIIFLAAILATISIISNSFVLHPKLSTKPITFRQNFLSMAEEGKEVEEKEDPKLFQMNRIVRLGRSRDEVIRNVLLLKK